jgi:signal transduction histidine kinase
VNGTAPITAMSWPDRIAEMPVESVLVALGLLVLAIAAGWALRHVARRTRSLRRLLLVMTFGALLVGAAVAVALAALMVLDADGVWTALAVLAVTGVLATVLILTASGPLGSDVRALESAVRRIEAGDLTVRTGVRRADELGHVARAVDELTERLDTMERERQAIEEERRVMLSSIGHDLRTPLSALRAAVEALADGVAPDPERYLRSMQADVEALGALVDDLFLLARIESGRLDLDQVPLDLSELVDEAVEALTPAAASHGVTIERDTPRRVRVAGNPTALGRVVRNLLDNAIQHAPAGSAVRIAVDGAKCPRVEVLDQGPGFPDEFTVHAFDRFTRADPSRTRSTGGAGLGLAIARGLVEAHGGRIWIGAPPGGRVTFELPAA